MIWRAQMLELSLVENLVNDVPLHQTPTQIFADIVLFDANH